MAQTIETFPGVEELTINPAKVLFRQEDIIGSGGYGTVYRATDDGVKYDDEVVVKKIRLSEFEKGVFTYVKPMFQRFYKGKLNSLRREVKAQNKFSQNGVSPRVFFADYEKMYYVMERMGQYLIDSILEIEIIKKILNFKIRILPINSIFGYSWIICWFIAIWFYPLQFFFMGLFCLILSLTNFKQTLEGEGQLSIVFSQDLENKALILEKLIDDRTMSPHGSNFNADTIEWITELNIKENEKTRYKAKKRRK